jgi:predicted cation transporter
MNEGKLEVTYIFETIEKIADKIGLTAKELWPYLVKQEIIESSISLAVLIIVGMIAIYVRKVYGTKFSEWDDATDTQKPLAIIPLVVGFIVMITIACKITVLLNPEYYAFNNLITLIK